VQSEDFLKPPSYFQFLIFIHFKQFKVLYELHLKFYKSSLNSNSNKATCNKNFLKFYKSSLNSNSNKTTCNKVFLKFYKSSLNSNSNKATPNEFFGCVGIDLCSVQWFVFYEFLIPLLWGAITFSFLICFWWLLVS
jgi:hypothetical protein